MSPVTGKAAKRLEPRTTTPTFPGAPIPGLNQINGDSVVTPQRLYYFKLTKWSPIRHLTPELLGQYYDLWEQGYLRYLALLYQAIENRDGTLKTVIPKRKGSVKRLRWEILIKQGLTDQEKSEAEKHKIALQYFYDNLSATSSIDLNLKAGLPMLLDQMMNSRGYRWAVHELIMQPSPQGLTCRFNWIPLWFFENRTGKLRFLEMDYQLEGRDLKDGCFMVTTSPDCLMEPCAVAYLFASLSLKWWLTYIEGHAMPIKVGKTKAPLGSTNYENFKNVLRDLATDTVVAIGVEEDVESLDLKAAGPLPYEPLVDRMHRAMAAIWRGADLSTISGRTSQGGQGATLQGKEEYYLTVDDAGLLSETFNMNIDPLVIGWTFGEDVKPLAYFKLIVPPNIEAAIELDIFESFINQWGMEVGEEQLREHFGVAKMSPDDTPVHPLMPAGGASTQPPDPSKLSKSEQIEAANIHSIAPDVDVKLLENAQAELAKSTSDVFAPVRDAIGAMLEMSNETRAVAYQRFKAKMPELLARLNRNPANAVPIYEAMCAGWFNGLLNAEVVRQ